MNHFSNSRIIIESLFSPPKKVNLKDFKHSSQRWWWALHFNALQDFLLTLLPCSAFSINFSRIDELCGCSVQQHLQNNFLRFALLLSKMFWHFLTLGGWKSMSRVISSTFLLLQPKQTLQSNDSRNLLGAQFEIKFLAAIVHKLMVTQKLHTVVDKQQIEQHRF